MSIAVRCKRCGREFSPGRRAIVAGLAVWRLCPECRAPRPQAEAAGAAEGETARPGPAPAPGGGARAGR